MALSPQPRPLLRNNASCIDRHCSELPYLHRPALGAVRLQSRICGIGCVHRCVYRPRARLGRPEQQPVFYFMFYVHKLARFLVHVHEHAVLVRARTRQTNPSHDPSTMPHAT